METVAPCPAPLELDKKERNASHAAGLHTSHQRKYAKAEEEGRPCTLLTDDGVNVRSREQLLCFVPTLSSTTYTYKEEGIQAPVLRGWWRFEEPPNHRMVFIVSCSVG